MEKGLISDAQLTASSAWNNNPKRYGAHRARLNLDTWPAGWSTKKFDPKPWLQIDLGAHKMVTGVATQGLGKSVGEWVKTYRVGYSDDGVKWHVMRNGGRKKVGREYNHSCGNRTSTTIWQPCWRNEIAAITDSQKQKKTQSECLYSSIYYFCRFSLQIPTRRLLNEINFPQPLGLDG